MVGGTVVALAAGQAWATDCPPDGQASAPGAGAPAPVGTPVVPPVTDPVTEPGTADPGAAGPGTAADPGAQAPGPAADPAAAALPSDSDLYVVRLDPDAAPPGGTTTVHAFVGNLGPDTTASPFTVVVTLPDGVTAEEPFFPENCYAFQDGHRVRCSFPPGLPKYRSATALIPVRLAASLPAPGTLTGGWVSLRSADDRHPENNRQPFEIAVVETTEPRPAV
ncbi:hypothetical protein ACFCX4_09535 [Kitasatospora sp. NPDC056327]|uniref:hypothetical protein n=1 Tax=Kitasatospora sp. NPDC056327 TaxID=3345785 RepID=UPI0035DCC580